MRKPRIFFSKLLTVALCVVTPVFARTEAQHTAAPPATAPAAAVPAKPQGQPLDNLMNNWLNRRELQHSFVGLEVMELPSGKILFSSNGNRRFAPASTTKVLTTACALSLLGPNFAYKTQLLGSGKITGDTVSGDLVFVPSQDPSMTRNDLIQMLSALAKEKVTKVNGSLRLAPTPGGYEVFQSDWLIEDFGQDYSPVCSNFVIDRNVAQGVPNLKNIKVNVEGPAEHYNALDRSLIGSEAASGWMTYNPSIHEIRAFIGRGVTEKSPLSVSDPDEYNLALANEFAQQVGITIGHPFATSVAADILQHNGAGFFNFLAQSGSTVLVEHISKPLPALLQLCLHESDNLYAQQFVRTLGLPANPAAAKPVKVQPTLEQVGLSRLSHWLSAIGISQEEAVLFDGCGLSRKNGISPHALNMVYKYMAGPNLDGPFLGLLKHSVTSTGKGQFVFKTGSMDTVRSISGVMQTAGGQHLAMTVIVNDHQQSVKGLRGTFGELENLLNQITSISYIPPPEPAPGQKEQPVKATVELTHAAPAASSHTRHRRRHH
jgi:D-alanyl-D-alanine carboxypeptidase/D-alanyl-D-alanine-endopeptidase (penicillin-binding protein 4)